MRILAPLIRTLDTRTVRMPRRQSDPRFDPIYNTPQFAAFRAEVVGRAGRQCEAIENGVRCDKGWPQHRVYADHIVELRDGGSPFDVMNGQCLCASHHELKTVQARIARMKR
jgi:hypothetical protein